MGLFRLEATTPKSYRKAKNKKHFAFPQKKSYNKCMRKTSSKKQLKSKIKLKRPTRIKDIKETPDVNRDERGFLLPGKSLNPKGRPKGSKNKFTTLKKAFLEAFEELGGVAGLVQWARYCNDNMKTFYQMTARMLPREFNIGDKELEPNDLSTLKEEELDAIIAKNLKRQ